MKFSTNYVCILYIILLGREVLALGIDAKYAALVFVEHVAKDEAAIEVGPAHPGYFGVVVYVGNVATVANNACVVGVSVFTYVHGVGLGFIVVENRQKNDNYLSASV